MKFEKVSTSEDELRGFTEQIVFHKENYWKNWKNVSKISIKFSGFI